MNVIHRHSPRVIAAAVLALAAAHAQAQMGATPTDNSGAGGMQSPGTSTYPNATPSTGGTGSMDAQQGTTGANSGTIDGFAFSGVESVNLSGGSDTATVNSGGSLSGNLSFGAGSDTLNYGSYGSAVSVTLSTITSGVRSPTALSASAPNWPVPTGPSSWSAGSDWSLSSRSPWPSRRCGPPTGNDRSSRARRRDPRLEALPLRPL